MAHVLKPPSILEVLRADHRLYRLAKVLAVPRVLKMRRTLLATGGVVDLVGQHLAVKPLFLTLCLAALLIVALHALILQLVIRENATALALTHIGIAWCPPRPFLIHI